MQVVEKRIGYFQMTDMLTKAGLDHFLLSNGDLLVLPIDSGHSVIKKPAEKLPTYSRQNVQFVIESMGGNTNEI